jgi:large conductance mechanosensitive channel
MKKVKKFIENHNEPHEIKGSVNRHFTGFLDFIREQGVIGLAIGFILGGSVKNVVSSLVTDIINPILGLILGSTEDLASVTFPFFGAEIKYGSFLSVTLDFVVVALVVYFGVRILALDRLDKKK